MRDRRLRTVYGCVGADRPEAEPFIDDIDGISVFTCPDCRKGLEQPRPVPFGTDTMNLRSETQ